MPSVLLVGRELQVTMPSVLLVGRELQYVKRVAVRKESCST